MELRTVTLSDAVVFRKVGTELIAIHTRTGKFYYFSEETNSFFSFFQRDATLNEFFQANELTGSSPEFLLEREYLGSFLEQLVSLGLFEAGKTLAAEVKLADGDILGSKYKKPKYLRCGETNLDEVTFAFLYP